MAYIADPRMPVLVATISDTERTIVENRSWAEDDPNFRDMRSMMQGNTGTL